MKPEFIKRVNDEEKETEKMIQELKKELSYHQTRIETIQRRLRILEGPKDYGKIA